MFHARRRATAGRVQAERESLFMRQSTVAFERISCISCSRCSHSEIWCIISFCLRIWQSHVLCLGVACGILKIEFFWRFCGYSRNAWLNSEYMFCISTWRIGRLAHNFYGAVNSNPEVFFLRSHAEWRSVLSRCLRCLEIGNSMHELHVADSLHDEG